MNEPTEKFTLNAPETLTQWLVWAVAISFCIFLLSISYWHRSNQKTTTAVEQNNSVVTHSVDAPDEKPPTDAYKWRGNPEDPKQISIASQSISGWLQKVGVDQNQQIAVPNNVHIGGWFVDSVLPGQKGLSIIDGHVSGRSSDGIFKRLPSVAEGDEITITFGDDSVKKFEVFAIKTVPVEESASILYSQDPKVTYQVNLITCSGKFANGGYEDRTIVSAVLVQ